jgi:hypothetical protein
VLVYLLAVVHTLGAGTDARRPWLLVLLLVTAVPVVFPLVVRLLPRPAATPRGTSADAALRGPDATLAELDRK